MCMGEGGSQSSYQVACFEARLVTGLTHNTRRLHQLCDMKRQLFVAMGSEFYIDIVEVIMLEIKNIHFQDFSCTHGCMCV